MKQVFAGCNFISKVFISLFFFSVVSQGCITSAQPVLFDFDNAVIHTPLPIDLTVGGITAHFSATGQGYSIQDANTMGFTPQGFAGNCIYPSSVYLSDLLISFDQTLSDFSIMYACQELGCDDAATMRVTAYMNSTYIGTDTRTATYPGTWPSDTLRCSFAQGFNNVVVHYDSRPPTCQDYGVIFLADNMRVTIQNPTGIVNPGISIEDLIITNPVSQSAIISFSLSQPSSLNAAVYDITGRLMLNLSDGILNSGEHQLKWDVNNNAIEGGVYFLKLSGRSFFRSCKIVVVK